MARAALKLGVRELAEKCGLAANTISLIENGGTAKTTSLVAIERALSACGVTFLPPNKDGPGIRVTPQPD
ncbi:helix-turn-helix transcriptional regulator [Bosea sp. FBZP-16]|uniref:helix-turn-helix domain-containing protein n=1 Tax=Bosea sp. FBZP-16 TaxID=2065382 RepID=UPI000C30DCA2|nr:helix-turn-helix transcriptional regulator [Bosea sp. FBZP-16]